MYNLLNLRFYNKEEHFNILQEYYGRMKNAPLSWKQINKMVSAMFSHDLAYEDVVGSSKTLHFYGNDAVCLFKYFVRPDDPQKLFVWGVLFTNLLSFAIIAICYLKIYLVAAKSAQNVGHKADGYHLQTQRKIAAIILTDFLCWFPFITLCVLHSSEILDMTYFYSFFSIVVLPINSVINPLLYSEQVFKNLKNFTIRNMKLFKKTEETRLEVIEMQEVNEISDANGTRETTEMQSMREIHVQVESCH